MLWRRTGTGDSGAVKLGVQTASSTCPAPLVVQYTGHSGSGTRKAISRLVFRSRLHYVLVRGPLTLSLTVTRSQTRACSECIICAARETRDPTGGLGGP